MVVVMNIGIDIDDTIVNTYETLLKLISMKYELDYNDLISKKLEYKDIFNSLDNFSNVNKDLFSIMVKAVKLKDNVVDIFNKLKNEGHKIMLITARNYGDYDEPYKVTYDYLTKNNVLFDKIIVNMDKKDKVCLDEKIDLFIDDNTKHCRDVSSVGINTLQFDALFNENINEFKKVSSWNEVYKFINSLENI